MSRKNKFTDLGFARVDTDRKRRCGFPRGHLLRRQIAGRRAGDQPDDFENGPRAAKATRASAAHFRTVAKEFLKAKYHARGGCITIEMEPLPKNDGAIEVLCAGTADLPVAEEAVATLEIFGNRVEKIFDVGVAGIHRLLAERDRLESCNALVVVAGMEGALPSAVAGLVSKPVIAVPTSIGYGASFGGLAALLGMLNSCGVGVTVVNIDNGFGAAYAAATINRILQKK